MEIVLQALIKGGLTLKPSKCEFARDKIQFLGHIVSSQGIEAQPRILRKVQEFQPPKDVKTLKSFLGLCNYYREFVPKFSEVAVPLNRLLQKNVKFEWSETCQTAFEVLKRSFQEPPLLIHPEIGGTFYILTDASQYAVGSAVCHKINDIYRPIVYYSHTMNRAECNYSVNEKEALAVVKTVKYHEDMLHGAKLIIVTDHKPLIPLFENAYKAPSARLR